MYQIAVIDDDVTFCRDLTKNSGEGFAYHTFHTFENFVQGNTDYDMILLDIGLPDISGIDAVSLIKNKNPEAKICILSIFQDEKLVFEAIKRGALGYILKTDTSNIKDLILQLLNGGAVLTQSIAMQFVHYFQKKEEGKKKETCEVLTLRENQILDHIINGKNTKMIAGLFGTSEGTVRNQIKSIYKKLHVSGRVDLILRFKD